jgi:hypothetical protein
VPPRGGGAPAAAPRACRGASSQRHHQVDRDLRPIGVQLHLGERAERVPRALERIGGPSFQAIITAGRAA